MNKPRVKRPPTPEISLRKSFTMIQRMQDRLDDLDLYGQTMNFYVADRVTTILLATLGLNTAVKRHAMLNSVLTLSGHPFNYNTSRTLIRRLVTSVPQMENGQPVNAGQVTVLPEGWHVLQVLESAVQRGVVTLVLNIDYGPCTDVQFNWNLRAGDSNLVGLWRRLKLPRTYMGQWNYLTQMRFWAWLRVINGVPIVSSTRTDSSIKGVNDQIVRFRRPPCPHRYNKPCVLCPVGYDKCPAGCHRFTVLKVIGHDTDQDSVSGSDAGDAGSPGVDEPPA